MNTTPDFSGRHRPKGFKLRQLPKRINATVALAGDYKFRVLDGVTREVKHETDWMHNLVTDIGLDRIGSGSAIGGFCRIGTGTTAPANTDTALVSQSASTAGTSGALSKVNAGSPNYETQCTLTYEFALGAVVGNMAEVGVGWASTGATLFSRARIVDGGGSPTTITVLVTEILQVTYRLTIYPKITDTVSTVVISGITYDFTARLYSAGVTMQGWDPNGSPLGSASTPTVYTGAIGAITGTPSGTTATMAVSALAAYTNGTYYREFTITATISQGNATGGSFKSMVTSVGNGSGDCFRTQIEFTPNVPKDSTKTFSMVMRFSWARH